MFSLLLLRKVVQPSGWLLISHSFLSSATLTLPTPWRCCPKHQWYYCIWPCLLIRVIFSLTQLGSGWQLRHQWPFSAFSVLDGPFRATFPLCLQEWQLVRMVGWMGKWELANMRKRSKTNWQKGEGKKILFSSETCEPLCSWVVHSISVA